jgi:hypothetical protein
VKKYRFEEAVINMNIFHGTDVMMTYCWEMHLHPVCAVLYQHTVTTTACTIVTIGRPHIDMCQDMMSAT